MTAPTRRAKPARCYQPHPDHTATIDRMRQLAAQSGDALLLAEGPPHPDAALLDLCSEALHWAKQAAEALSAYHAHLKAHAVQRWTDSDRADSNELHKAWQDPANRVRPLLTCARKLRATTPAGIYAKALIVSISRTGAECLSMSLAQDLIASPAIRASIWPAEAVS